MFHPWEACKGMRGMVGECGQERTFLFRPSKRWRMPESVFSPSFGVHGLLLASCSVLMTDCTSSMTYFRSLVVRRRDSKGTCAAHHCL